MPETIPTLIDFITAAERSRKYFSAAASGIRTALRLFESVLTDDEKASIDVFKQRFEQIFQEVFNKYSTKYSAGSLQTYKKRIVRLLNDYYTYGKDPAKMASWSPKTISRKSRKISSLPTQPFEDQRPIHELMTPETSADVDRLEIHLPSGAKALLIIPSNLEESDAERITTHIKASVVKMKKDQEKPPVEE